MLMHLGRWVLASLFILGGINKLVNPDGAIAMMLEAGIPMPEFLVWAVIALELGGGLLVGIGRGPARPAALVLIVHTAAINLWLHPFWAVPPELTEEKVSIFFKNISIMGGLAMVAGGIEPARPRVISRP